jgi:hypothetical protein
MCLMLYVSTAEALPLRADPDLSVEVLPDRSQGVTRWLSQPAVRIIGAHTAGCSCGFPSVIADTAVEYFDGMWANDPDRALDLRSVQALIDLLHVGLQESPYVELYPVPSGCEADPPKGRIDWRLASLEAETLFFNEQFLHVVRK